MNLEELLEAFGRNLRESRENAGITQEELARMTGVHQTSISKIERGKREPRLGTTFRLAKGVRKSPGELLDEVRREVAVVEGETIEELLEEALYAAREARRWGDFMKLEEAERLIVEAIDSLRKALTLIREGRRKEDGEGSIGPGPATSSGASKNSSSR